MTIFTESGWIERKRPQNRKEKKKKSPVQNRSFKEDNFWHVHQND